MEERAARPAVGLGDLDAHDAEVEQLFDQRLRDLRLLIHFADERPDLRGGELADAVAEDPFVFGEHGQGLGNGGGILGHGNAPVEDDNLRMLSSARGRDPLRDV